MKVVLISGSAMAGKDQSATFLKEIMEQDGKKVLITHYADLLKYLCKTYFGWNGEKDEEGRTILQFVGSDIIRKKNPDYWVNFIASFLKLFEDQFDVVLIPDTRFPNEITSMIDYGFDTLSVRVNRMDFKNSLTEEQRKHISETALDDFKFDYYIDTISDLDYLKSELVEFYEGMLKEDLNG